MPANPTIELTQAQLNEAAAVAKQLHDSLRKRGVKDGHGLRKKDATAEMETCGAAGEMALSLYLNVPWTAKTSKDKFGPDVGTRTQVRCSNVPRSSHHLIFRSRDWEKYRDVPFVLMIQTGRTFEIKGWMMASDILKQGRLWDGGDRDRPPAWFVHEDKLLPISTLENP